MIREGRRFGFALLVLMSALPGMAEDRGRNPMVKNVLLASPRAAQLDLYTLTPGLSPLPFRKNTDVRARLLTPELRRTPVVGWIAANLYRDKKENGWYLELDPGQGEYVVFYRVHL